MIHWNALSVLSFCDFNCLERTNTAQFCQINKKTYHLKYDCYMITGFISCFMHKSCWINFDLCLSKRKNYLLLGLEKYLFGIRQYNILVILLFVVYQLFFFCIMVSLASQFYYDSMKCRLGCVVVTHFQSDYVIACYANSPQMWFKYVPRDVLLLWQRVQVSGDVGRVKIL